VANDQHRAAKGEKSLSSLQSGEAAAGEKMARVADETQASPAADASWDPYQVWLTRVKQPREQSARRRSRPVTVEPAGTVDLSETARLRALSIQPR